MLRNPAAVIVAVSLAVVSCGEEERRDLATLVPSHADVYFEVRPGEGEDAMARLLGERAGALLRDNDVPFRGRELGLDDLAAWSDGTVAGFVHETGEEPVVLVGVADPVAARDAVEALAAQAGATADTAAGVEYLSVASGEAVALTSGALVGGTVDQVRRVIGRADEEPPLSAAHQLSSLESPAGGEPGAFVFGASARVSLIDALLSLAPEIASLEQPGGYYDGRARTLANLLGAEGEPFAITVSGSEDAVDVDLTTSFDGGLAEQLAAAEMLAETRGVGLLEIGLRDYGQFLDEQLPRLGTSRVPGSRLLADATGDASLFIDANPEGAARIGVVIRVEDESVVSRSVGGLVERLREADSEFERVEVSRERVGDWKTIAVSEHVKRTLFEGLELQGLAPGAASPAWPPIPERMFIARREERLVLYSGARPARGEQLLARLDDEVSAPEAPALGEGFERVGTIDADRLRGLDEVDAGFGVIPGLQDLVPTPLRFDVPATSTRLGPVLAALAEPGVIDWASVDEAAIGVRRHGEGRRTLRIALRIAER